MKERLDRQQSSLSNEIIPDQPGIPLSAALAALSMIGACGVGATIICALSNPDHIETARNIFNNISEVLK